MVAQAREITLTGRSGVDVHDWYTASEPRSVELAGFDAVLMRKDPPFDSEYFYATHLRPITNMRPKLGINPWQFMADTHLVDWLEVKGFTVDIITDHDLHVEGMALLKPYKVVVSGSHPEYPSWQMLEAIRGYLNQGGRFRCPNKIGARKAEAAVAIAGTPGSRASVSLPEKLGKIIEDLRRRSSARRASPATAVRRRRRRRC